MAERVMSEQGRLDYAAKAYGMADALNSMRWPSLAFTLFFLLLAISSNASKPETVFLWTYFAISMAGTTGLLFRKMHVGYWIALTFFSLAIARPFFWNLHSGHPDAFERTSYLFYYGLLGYVFWRGTAALIRVESADWGQVKQQVDQWVEILQNPERNPQVMEFRSKSFWKGSYTYRVLVIGDLWIEMRMEDRVLRRSTGYRVRDRRNISVRKRSDGRMEIEIAGKPIPQVQMSPDMSAILLSVVRGS